MPTISRKKRVIVLVLGLIAFAAIAHSAYRNLLAQKTEQNSVAPESMSQGMILPSDTSLETLGGRTSGISDYNGRVILINFWAGWCGPCLSEMPGLFALYGRLKPKGFEVLAVNMDNDPSDGMRVLRQKVGEAPFPVFKGANSSLANMFPIGGLPYTVVIDKDRKIHYAKAGEVNWNGSEAVKMIEGML